MCNKKFILTIAVLLSACETIPQDQLSASAVSAMVVDSASVVVSSNAEALAHVKAVPLTPNARVKTKIELTDAAMLFDGVYGKVTFDAVHGNFKLFSFTSESTARYKISLMTFGSLKYRCSEYYEPCVLYPLAYVFNREGVVVSTPKSLEYVEPGFWPWEEMGHLLGIWEGDIGQGETLYFLVAADNRHPGSTITGMPANVRLRSYQTGTISVELSLDGS